MANDIDAVEQQRISGVAYQRGVADERERCAKIADEAQRVVNEETGPAPYVAAEIAKKIRNQ